MLFLIWSKGVSGLRPGKPSWIRACWEKLHHQLASRKLFCEKMPYRSAQLSIGPFQHNIFILSGVKLAQVSQNFLDIKFDRSTRHYLDIKFHKLS